MKNKIFLSSMLIMSFAPAFAENFPSNGLMQENTTYTNAATETNMAGVYEGSVNATAEYTDILYNIVAGNYLPGGSEDVNGTQCTAGNFCTGLTNATYSESDQGLTSCSTLGDGSYTLSPAGATNGNMCYKTCSASCTNPTAPAHSTNVTFGHETSNGTCNYGSTCNAVAPTCSINFDCVNGYHKRPDLTVAQGVALMKQMAQAQGQDITNVPDSYFESQVIDGYANWNSFWSSLSAAEQGMVTQAIDSVQGHTHTGQTQTVATWQPFLNVMAKVQVQGIDDYNDVGSIANYIGPMYIGYNKTLSGNETCYYLSETISCDTLSQQNAQLASFRQNAQNGDFFGIVPSENISFSGTYKCEPESENNEYSMPYFQIHMINGVSASSEWATGDAVTYTSQCLNDLNMDREALIDLFIWGNYKNGYYSDEFSYGSFYTTLQVASDTITISGSAPYIDYMCDANTININWLGADDEDITANNAGTAKYDGDIRTPVKAQTIKGKTFRGWRFSKPETTNLPE